MRYFLFIPPWPRINSILIFRTTFVLLDFVFPVRLIQSNLLSFQLSWHTLSISPYGLPNESFTVGFFMALPCLKERFYLPFYFQHMQLQWHRSMHAQSSALLHLCSSNQLMEGGTATREIVPREWDDQNATSPEHSNQRKKRSISKPVIFYCKIVATESSC